MLVVAAVVAVDEHTFSVLEGVRHQQAAHHLGHIHYSPSVLESPCTLRYKTEQPVVVVLQDAIGGGGEPPGYRQKLRVMTVARVQPLPLDGGIRGVCAKGGRRVLLKSWCC